MKALTLDDRIRLEGIFMPNARSRREKAYPKKNAVGKEPARFVHYTTAEAALKIIRSKRMWMRNTTCMADYREVQHGFEILLKIFDKPRTEAFAAVLDKCAPGAAMQAIKLFNERFNTIRFDTYITSISEHDESEDQHGRLSMWRAFGTDTNARVALVLKVPWDSEGALESLQVFFGPVAYPQEREALSVLYDDVLKNIEANPDYLRSFDPQIILGYVFVMLLSGVTCLKHEGFREEREWRAIYHPALYPQGTPSLIESSTEVVGGVPQIVHKLPLDATVDSRLADLDFSRLFDRLIIGPSQYPAPMLGAFIAELTKAGVPDARTSVVVSGIPIRS
jgi:hypothetical protein